MAVGDFYNVADMAGAGGRAVYHIEDGGSTATVDQDCVIYIDAGAKNADIWYDRTKDFNILIVNYSYEQTSFRRSNGSSSGFVGKSITSWTVTAGNNPSRDWFVYLDSYKVDNLYWAAIRWLEASVGSFAIESRDTYTGRFDILTYANCSFTLDDPDELVSAGRPLRIRVGNRGAGENSYDYQLTLTKIASPIMITTKHDGTGLTLIHLETGKVFRGQEVGGVKDESLSDDFFQLGQDDVDIFEPMLDFYMANNSVGSGSGIITGWDDVNTGLTRRLLSSTNVTMKSALDYPIVRLFDTAATIPDGVYEFQFDISGVITGTGSALLFYSGDQGANPWADSNLPYISIPFLPGDYSGTSGTFTLFYRKVGTNGRWFFPAYGPLPMNYSSVPEIAQTFGQIGQWNSPKLETNSRFSFFALGNDENITINSLTMKFTPPN
jgi:hypothetical protein